MRKFFSKMSLIGLLALVCGMFHGCKPETEQSNFNVSVKEVGPEYVILQVKAPAAVDIAYMLDTKEMRVDNPVMVFASGESLTVKPEDEVRISGDLKEDTQYYLYVVAKLDAQNYSEIVTLPFKTVVYDLDELITVVDQSYDGFKVRLTVPEETKQRGNAIRYTQCDLMMYNYMQSNDYSNLLYNGGAYTKFVTDDETIVYSEETNWYQTGEDSDGDGEIDWETNYNPISPGEPIVYVAGEFSWMDGDQDALLDDNGDEIFGFPGGWDPGYFMPMIDPAYFTGGASANEQSSMGIITDYEVTRPMDSYWTGAFQRKHFFVKQPQPFDGEVDVQLVEASPIDLVMDFYPGKGVKQYAVGVFDDSMYQQILDLCNGREEYMQWAVTSYFGAYTFGTRVAKDPVRMALTSFYYQDAIGEDTEYHVLVTAMGDNAATIQNFQHFKFKTTKKTKDAPVVQVTALEDEATPYVAKFNVKCTTAAEGNPLKECYYAANYKRDWLLEINGGATYFSLVAGNKAYSYFTAEEIAKINSDEGLELTIASIDGETTRVAVLGYNDEYTPNDLVGFTPIQIEDGECPGIADCTTPWLEEKPYVDERAYLDLVGDWTAKATLESAQDGKNFIHTSKISLAADILDFPVELPDSVYNIYKETSKYDAEKVEGLWSEFKELAKTVTDRRLVYQNRLIAKGWLDADSYSRLDYYGPYDLFVDRTYKSVDVSSIFYDFGPKWYIEAVEDENGNISLIAPFDANFLPPAANWSIPFYLSGMELENYYTVTYGDGWTPSFPVEVSEDRNTITIKPLVYDGKEFFPNMVGIDYSMNQTILENFVVSEIVMTRGWNEPAASRAMSSSSVNGKSIQPKGEFPKSVCKPMTELKAAPELKTIEGKIVSVEEFKKRADKYVEMRFKQNN